MRSSGFIMVLIGASLWGLSGTAAQQLFQHDHFSPSWLVTVRMVLSGLLLLILVALGTSRRSMFNVWRNGRDALRLIVFSTVGLAGVQYTYFAAIKVGNAATATFLQYLGPLLVFIYVLIATRQTPSRKEYVALALALIGIFLLVTNGSLQTIHVPVASVLWGIASAFALAFYTVHPAPLIARYGSATIVGWAMLIGGFVFFLFAPPWQTSGQHWSAASVTLILFISIFGTFIAFYLYLASLRFITPSETSLLACFEPLSAALATVWLLHVRLGVWTLIGGLCIVGTVALLAIPKQASRQAVSQPTIHSG